MSNDRSKTLVGFKEDHEVVGPVGRDILLIEDVPETGNSITGGVTIATLFSNTAANVVLQDNFFISANNVIIRKRITPVTSSDIVANGTIWFDGDYIYAAVANNVIRRAALESF